MSSVGYLLGGRSSSVAPRRALRVGEHPCQNCPPGVGGFAAVGSLADTPASSASARAPGGAAAAASHRHRNRGYWDCPAPSSPWLSETPLSWIRELVSSSVETL